MANHEKRDPGTPRGSETAVPAGLMEMMERARCRCAPMMAMCGGADQDTEPAMPAEATATDSEGEVDP